MLNQSHAITFFTNFTNATWWNVLKCAEAKFLDVIGTKAEKVLNQLAAFAI
jgi:hypothetical protein